MWIAQGIQRLATDRETISSPNGVHFSNHGIPLGTIPVLNYQQTSIIAQLKLMPTKPAHLHRVDGHLTLLTSWHSQQRACINSHLFLNENLLRPHYYISINRPTHYPTFSDLSAVHGATRTVAWCGASTVIAESRIQRIGSIKCRHGNNIELFGTLYQRNSFECKVY